MTIKIQQSAVPGTRWVQTSRWVPIAVLALEAPWGIWCVYSLLGGGGSEAVAFEATAGSFVVLAIAYIALHGLRNMAWTSVLVLLTVESLAGFIGIPAWQFAMGDATLDTSYVHAMFLVVVGFAALWLGSVMLMNDSGVRFTPRTRDTSRRVSYMSLAMLGLGVIGNLVLWRTGLLSYASDPALRAASLGYIQWITFLANLLGYAVIVSAIEVFGKRSTEPFMKIVFWLSLVFAISFGVISGMKSGPLHPIAYVLMIYGIIRRRLPRAAILLPVLLVVIIYPFVNAFRANLNGGYRAQFNTVGGLEDTLAQSFDDAFRSYGATSLGAGKQNFDTATSRLSYLTYVRAVYDLPAPSMLNGDEKVWMAPLYPLIPRFLWPGKPVLNKGQRLSFLLGIGSESSSALTPIGDLYAMYGTYGVVAGMLVWGTCLQLYMNWIGRRAATEKSLLVFMLMLPSILDLENDFIGLIAGAVQTLMIALLISYVIYGWSEAFSQAPDSFSPNR